MGNQSRGGDPPPRGKKEKINGGDSRSGHARMLRFVVADERLQEQFILLITLGYVAGIAAKFVSGSLNWVLAVYFINLACIGVNWAVYVRNRRLDARRSLERSACA